MRNCQRPASLLTRSGFSRAMAGIASAGLNGSAMMTANAEIIYSGPQNLSTSSLIGVPFAEDSKPVNIDGMGEAEFVLQSFDSKGWDFHLFYDEARFDNFAPVLNVVVARLDAGDTIGPGESYYTGGGLGIPLVENLPNDQWSAGTEGYFGFHFNPAGNQDLYGWGQVNISADNKVLTLVDWAYENTGAPIPAGQVPEPTTSLLLAGGLIVIGLWRRSKGGRSS